MAFPLVFLEINQDHSTIGFKPRNLPKSPTAVDAASTFLHCLKGRAWWFKGRIFFDQTIDYFEVHSVCCVKQVAGKIVVFLEVRNEYPKDSQIFCEGKPSKIMPFFPMWKERVEALFVRSGRERVKLSHQMYKQSLIRRWNKLIPQVKDHTPEPSIQKNERLRDEIPDHFHWNARRSRMSMSGWSMQPRKTLETVRWKK